MPSDDQTKLAMVQPSTGATDIFAVAYLQLCQISYLLPASLIPNAVAKMPPLNSGGSWQCIWGPAQTADDGNLAFVASYRTAAGMPPVFATVVIRGTDVDIHDGWGIILQIWEDLDVTSQVPLPWDPGNPARIANGTADGLGDIQGLTSNNQTLLQFLGSYLSSPANASPLLVVTGHSLGGCLASVVAPWLQSALGAQVKPLHVIPATFAAPTAGNAAFAQYFQSTFGYSLRVFNTLDVAPFAWSNIVSVVDLYVPQCNIFADDYVYLGALGFIGAMDLAKVSYAQPMTNQVPLQGSCAPNVTDWYDEAFYQHHTTTYMSLLGGTSVVSQPPAPPPRPSRLSRLRQRLGPLTDHLRS